MNLLILIAYIVYVGVFGHANGHTCVNDRPRVRQFEEAQRARREFNEKYNRTRIDVGETEQLALKSIFRDIENAYTNYQVEAMAAAMAKVSNRIDRVQNQLYIDLHWGMEGFLINYFIHGCGARRRIQFDSPAEFERFVATHTKMAFFLGECYLRRNDFESYIVCLDFEVFAALKKYADRFHGEGKKDLEEIARRYRDKWIEHIESEKGFTRRYAYFLMDSYEAEIIRGKCTREEAVKWARSSTDPLIKRGYTPKWLDEFFDADELALKAIYLDIERAYTSNQAEAMVQAMARAAEHVGRVRDRPFFVLDWGFIGLLERRFLNDGRLRPFGSQPELERFMSIHAEMALFLSRCIDCDAEGNINYPIRELKRHVLDMFRKYVNQFHREGKKDFEAIAQKYLDKLNSQWVL